MSTRYDKIPAEEYARRHGWRKSAVINRIRTGIYDGVKEGRTWYVLENVASGTDSKDVVELVSMGAERPRRQLPWATVPGPFVWVTWVMPTAVAVVLILLLIGSDEGSLPLTGIAVAALFGSLLYEGLRTGTVRGRGYSYSYSDHPVWFTILALLYLLLVVTGLALAIP